MDDDHGIGSPPTGITGMRDDNINISDVIEVIETDLDFGQSTMFNGGSDITNTVGLPAMTPMPTAAASRPKVKIIEQPASKALRFRYECEGRSAGSIPGVSSTPENKTFPAIQIIGYQGRAVVVVSCVTKDQPHRPHPHNLVGREGCKKGVCTLEVSPETMSVTFSNLGIQCVKKKDIEAALKVREEIRVDPFRTGFAHRNQPTSIDLNAVRLCFQVFLEGEQRGKFTVPLAPVISEPIYDKKAMCDLIIVKLSDCVSTVDGGRKDIILLCEKVAKEDIKIRFFEEQNGQTVWEAEGEFQPSQVHKQTAIWFRAPRYKTLEVTEPVKVFIQLLRPSDGATSESLPFEYLPLDSGRPAFWSFRRNLSKKGNYNLFNTILANDARLVAKRQLSNGKSTTSISQISDVEVPKVDSNPTQTHEWCDYTEIAKNQEVDNKNEDKSFNEIIDQVAELDEIYSESRAISNHNGENTTEADFDDARTYSSLQLAFKNPLAIKITEFDKDKRDDITIVNPISPVIDVATPLKRESEIEKLPPLPPKRVRKVTDICDPYVPSITSTTDEPPKLRNRSASLCAQSQSQNEFLPRKDLPPTPCSTLPNPKKKGFFSKIFNKNKREKAQSLEILKRNSIHNSKTNIDNALNAENTLNIIAPSNPENQDTITNSKVDLNANDDLNMNIDLTEAEHYALYMAMAPHATQSEFDEMSCYYSPVEGGRILTDSNFVPIIRNSDT